MIPLCILGHNTGMKRGIRVVELEDFICRCGMNDFDLEYREKIPIRMTCKKCSRKYKVKKYEKKTKIQNLPMSFGFRSLYWDKIEISDHSIEGILEQGYKIQEILKKERRNE